MLRADGNAFLTPDIPGSVSLICRRLTLPDFLWRFFHGAIGELIEPENWFQFGDMPISDVVDYFIEALDGMADCYMIGSILPFARETLPSNVLPCDGSTHLREDYPLLFPVLPASLILNSDEFVTPDLRGRFLLAEGPGRAFGDTGGSETHTLTIDEMPPHSHRYDGVIFDMDIEPPVGAPQLFTASLNPIATTDPEGNGEAHNNMPPFYVVQYGIVAK